MIAEKVEALDEVITGEGEPDSLAADWLQSESGPVDPSTLGLTRCLSVSVAGFKNI
ncbi:hypothetical protein AB0H18_11895 [Streptomyces sp. NPDC020766]|uniref:hypothetical protein n=1 Tax=Streptomyces sp. NPDC020766 TaxID=3155011 RepID=UPI0033D2DB8F